MRGTTSHCLTRRPKNCILLNSGNHTFLHTDAKWAILLTLFRDV